MYTMSKINTISYADQEMSFKKTDGRNHEINYFSLVQINAIRVRLVIAMLDKRTMMVLYRKPEY